MKKRDIEVEKCQTLFADLQKATLRLKEALDQPPTVFNQDSSIQRFEFTFEMAWKLMKSITTIDGLKAASPRQAIRQAATIGMIDNPKTWFDFLKKRNLTVHTYEEKIAQEVYQSAKKFVPYVEELLKNTQQYLSSF